MADKKDNVPAKDNKDKLPSEEPMDQAPDVTDTRVYSDFILYFVKSGRFQYHPLVDEKRRHGVLSLMGAERVTKLTLERRLSPVNIRLTPGEARQKVYLFAIVRQAVSLEQLDDIIRRLNDSLDGKTTDEKEAAVLELIYSTSSRVRPGIKFLPMYFYATEQYTAPPLDEDGREVDNQGLPVIASEDEVVAIQGGTREGTTQRGRGYISLPSTSTRLSDPSTDSEGMMGHSKAKRRGAPRKSSTIDWESVAAAAKRKSKGSHDEGPPAKRQDIQPGPASQTDPEVVQQGPETKEEPIDVSEPHERARDPSVITISDDASEPPKSVAEDEPLPEIDQENVIIADLPPEIRSSEDVQDMQRELTELRAKVGTFEQFMEDMKKREAQAAKQGLRLRSSRSTTRDRDGTPDMYTDEETRTKKLFPINTYTREMDWFLRQRAVHTFIYYEVMRVAYRTYPVFKPDAEFVIAKYMDYLLSTRLQSHLAKATGKRGKAKMDYGRAPMPSIVVQIAEQELTDLGKRRVPGYREVPEVMKDRCGAARRNKVIESDHVSSATSVEVMAHRLYNERMDFADANEWLLRDNKVKSWTYENELAKTKKLETGKRKPSDPTFDGKHEPFDPNLEELIFPDMDKGEVLADMDLAKEIANDLANSRISKPVFPVDVWELIKMVVEPTQADRAAAMASNEKKTKNRLARQGRRNVARQAKKKAAAAEDEDDLSDDDDDDDEQQENLEQFQLVTHVSPPKPSDEPQPSTSGVDSGGAKAKKLSFAGTGAIPKDTSVYAQTATAEDLFGSISDISSSNSSGKVRAKVTEEGTMIYSMEPMDDEGAKEAQTDKDPLHIPGPESGPGAAAVVLQAVTDSGMAHDNSNIGIATNTTTTKESQYSVVVSDSPRAGQSILKGQSDSRVHRTETLTRPPRDRTPYEQYENMEIDILDQGALEGQSSSESSNKDSSKSSKSNDDSNLLADMVKKMDMPPPKQDSAGVNVAFRQMDTQGNQRATDMDAKKEAARKQARTRLGMGRSTRSSNTSNTNMKK